MIELTVREQDLAIESRIHAIKAIRERTGAGLIEAKAAVDAYCMRPDVQAGVADSVKKSILHAAVWGVLSRASEYPTFEEFRDAILNALWAVHAAPDGAGTVESA